MIQSDLTDLHARVDVIQRRWRKDGHPQPVDFDQHARRDVEALLSAYITVSSLAAAGQPAARRLLSMGRAHGLLVAAQFVAGGEVATGAMDSRTGEVVAQPDPELDALMRSVSEGVMEAMHGLAKQLRADAREIMLHLLNNPNVPPVEASLRTRQIDAALATYLVYMTENDDKVIPEHLCGMIVDAVNETTQEAKV